MGESIQTSVTSGESKSASLATVLEARPLPPERFDNIKFNGKVTAIKTIGDKILSIQQMKDEAYGGVLINEKNETIDVRVDPSSYKIANSCGAYVPYEKSVGDTCRSFEELLREKGYGGSEISKYLVQWKSIIDSYGNQIRRYQDQKNMFFKSDMLAQPDFYLHAGDWDLETRLNNKDGSKSFVLKTRDSRLTTDFNGNVSRYRESTTSEPGEVALPNGQLMFKEKNLFHIKDKTGKTISTLSGISPAIDPSNPAIVYYIEDEKILTIDTSGLVDRTTKPINVTQIHVSDPQEINIDNNGNFLIIRDAQEIMNIVDKENGQIVKKFSEVLGPITINEDGDIIYVDSRNKLREIETNFKAIPKGGNAEAQKQRDIKLKEMQDQFTKLDLSTLHAPKTTTVTEGTVVQTLRESISTQVIDKINGATSAEDVEKILDQLQVLKSQKNIQTYEYVVEEFVTQARDKLSEINTTVFEGQLTTFHGSLQDVHTVGDTIDLDRRYAELSALRQKIEISDPGKRKEIDKVFEAVRIQKETLITQYQGVLLQTIQQTLPTIEQIVKECGSMQEISTIITDPQVQQFELMMTNIRDPKVRREMRDRYNEVKQIQRSELEVKERVVEEQRRLGWAQTIEETRADLEEIGKEISRIADIKDVSRYERNPLINAWRAKLLTLPPELRELEEKRLNIVLTSRKQDIEHRKNLGAVGEAGELKFGESTFSIFKEPPRIWQHKITPIPGVLSGLGYLVYEDAYGRVFDPHAVVNTDSSLPQTQEMITRYRQQADEYFEGMKRKIPEFNNHWVITDYHMEKLEEITDVLNIQRDNHEGILILEGEAGSGKNVMGDMLANLANMELVQIPCNENTAKEDLVYDFQFDPVKGTYKLPSRLIEAIQTPGSIVFFDEINALKPGITKLLNSLFDYHRKIFITEGGKTKEIAADPTVLFLGAMNPQNYLGVKPLSPEVKSRARVIDFNYPPFEEQKGGKIIYHPHEALMLSRYMGSLSGLKPQEFKDLWDFIVNKDESSPGSMIAQSNPEMKEQVTRMYDVLRVANKLRLMYESYQTGESNEPLDFPTSLREMTAIVMEMNHGRDVRKAIERVILPKIDDRSQRKFVKETIAAILPSS